MLQVFESHAEYLGPAQFTEFALPYIKQIQQRVRAKVSVPMVSLYPNPKIIHPPEDHGFIFVFLKVYFPKRRSFLFGRT